MYNIVCLATASTEVEEFVQKPGVVKTYLDKYTPAVIGFFSSDHCRNNCTSCWY